MKRKSRRWWMICIPVVIVGAILPLAFSTAQTKQPVTLEDIYALLVTEDGQNRLEEIQNTLEQMREKIDLVYLQAKEMMEEEGWQFEKQQWTLDDIKFLLDILDDKIDFIYQDHGGP